MEFKVTWLSVKNKLKLQCVIIVYRVSLLDSFMSQTTRHYQPHTGPDGSEALPNIRTRTRESGYLQLKTRPKAVSMRGKIEHSGIQRQIIRQKHGLIYCRKMPKKVILVRILNSIYLILSSRICSFRQNIMTALCHIAQDHQVYSSVKLFAKILDVQYMNDLFTLLHFPPESQKHLIVGQKGESGFTEEKAIEPNTFLPKNSYMVSFVIMIIHIIIPHTVNS